MKRILCLAVLVTGCASQPRYDQDGNLNPNAEQPLHLVGKIVIGPRTQPWEDESTPFRSTATTWVPKATLGACKILAVRQ